PRGWASLLTAMLGVILLAVPASALSAPRSYVASFGSDGLVSVDFCGASIDAARAVIVQRDGDIVAVGNACGVPERFAIARLTPTGALDPTFNSTGKVLVQFGQDALANAVALQSDCKIVVAGTIGSGYGNGFAVVRLNENGSLDPTFDDDG